MRSFLVLQLGVSVVSAFTRHSMYHFYPTEKKDHLSSFSFHSVSISFGVGEHFALTLLPRKEPHVCAVRSWATPHHFAYSEIMFIVLFGLSLDSVWLFSLYWMEWCCCGSLIIDCLRCAHWRALVNAAFNRLQWMPCEYNRRTYCMRSNKRFVC